MRIVVIVVVIVVIVVVVVVWHESFNTSFIDLSSQHPVNHHDIFIIGGNYHHSSKNRWFLKRTKSFKLKAILSLLRALVGFRRLTFVVVALDLSIFLSVTLILALPSFAPSEPEPEPPPWRKRASCSRRPVLSQVACPARHSPRCSTS